MPLLPGTGLNEQENGPCRACGGKRLSPLALAVTMSAPDRAYNLAELTAPSAGRYGWRTGTP